MDNESDVYSDTIAVEQIPPLVSTYDVVENTIYAHRVSTDTVWYGNAGPPTCSGCTFAVRVTATDAGSGLDRAEYPATVSAGGAYTTALAGDYQYEHWYTFDVTDTANGTYQVTVYDLAGNSAEASFTVWRDASPPPAPTNPLINGGDAWDADGTVTLTWDQVTDGGSGLEGYYAALGDPTPTIRADSVISDTETWTGPDTPAAPYYVRTRDNVGHWSAVASDTIGIDTLSPVVSLHSIHETSPYAHASGSTAYYSNLGSGSFALRVAASDAGSGLDQAEYPDTTSPGGVYNTALGGEYQYEHTYTFDGADTVSGTYTVTVRDAMGYESSTDFSVIRDATPPTLTLAALVQGDVLVTWSVEDSDPSTSSGQGSGVDSSTCLLEVREDEGAWQTFSTACAGDDAYDSEPGHTYTFRLTASDNVGNAASLEVEALVPYIKKYYYANGQRVAMQKEGVVYYLHTDHLGSTSILSDENGQQLTDSRVAYLPYGGVRLGDVSTLPTDFTFTGQRNEAGIGLMHYGARFYSPRLGRFVSADTIVPGAGNPQALNRYSYALGNPLRYNDPSGHQGGDPQAEFLQQVIDFYTKEGWQVVGDPINAKSIYCNGPDLVFTSESARVLSVEAKNVAGNVDLGTLGKSKIFGDYGGSIDRVIRGSARFLRSSNSQLKQEAEIVKAAAEAGNLENALFTTGQKVSQAAQAEFNGVYTLGPDGQVTAVKELEPLESPGFAAAVWTWAKDRIGKVPIVTVPKALVDPNSPYNSANPNSPLNPSYVEPVWD